MPEALKEKARSFIHRVGYSDEESGVCCLQQECRAGKAQLRDRAPAAELSSAPEHQVLRHRHTPARFHREHSTASQKLLNICFCITNKGREGRKKGQAFHQVKVIPITKLEEIRCRVFGISRRPPHLPPDTAVQRPSPGKTSILWTTVSSSVGKIFACIITTFLSVNIHRLVSFFHSWDCHSWKRHRKAFYSMIPAIQLHEASGRKSWVA